MVPFISWQAGGIICFFYDPNKEIGIVYLRSGGNIILKKKEIQEIQDYMGFSNLSELNNYFLNTPGNYGIIGGVKENLNKVVQENTNDKRIKL